MTGHDYDEMARLSALAVEAERRRAGLPTEPREAMSRPMPHDPDDDRGQQMLVVLACVVAVLFSLGLAAAVVLIRQGGQ